MIFGYVVVALIGAAVAIFALQNGTPTPVRFLVWAIPGVPVAGLALLGLLAGTFLAGLPLTIQRWMLRSAVRRLEARVSSLEAALQDRDRALLAQRSPSS
jgi:uncharacterized integral membrane protein